MAATQDKIRMEVFGPAETAETAGDSCCVSDDAVLRLARLIGRQIAREQFERARAREQKGPRQKTNSGFS